MVQNSTHQIYPNMAVQPSPPKHQPRGVSQKIETFSRCPTFPGWWLTYPSEKYDFVSWDDDIPNIWKNDPNVPNHQPVSIF